MAGKGAKRAKGKRKPAAVAAKTKTAMMGKGMSGKTAAKFAKNAAGKC